MRYLFNFEGSCEIEADSKEKAEESFWKYINDDKPLPGNLYTITGIIGIEEG